MSTCIKKHFKTSSKLLAASILVAASGIAGAYEQGDWIVRAGIINVDPDVSSGKIKVDGAELPGTSVGVGDDTQLGLNFVYMATDRIGVELLAATPFEHSLTAKGVAGINKLGTTKQLPPTLSVQYFFT